MSSPGLAQMDRDMRTSTVFGGPPAPAEPDEPHHSIFEPRPALNRDGIARIISNALGLDGLNRWDDMDDSQPDVVGCLAAADAILARGIPVEESGPVLHTRRASDAFEYKVERVLQIMNEKPTWTLPLPDYRREVYADQLALIRVALREIGV